MFFISCLLILTVTVVYKRCAYLCIYIIHTAYLSKVHHENFNKRLFVFLPESGDTHHFAVCLMNAFWKLHSCQPVNPVLSPLSSIGERSLITSEHTRITLRKMAFMPLFISSD